MRKKIRIFAGIIFMVSLASVRVRAQEEIVDVIDTPTAASVELGSYAFSMRLYDQGSIMTRLYYGIIMNNLTLGLSFDAENVVGTGDINAHRPYLYIKFPLYTGDYTWPALSMGFDEQGLGVYNDETDQYPIPPLGFFFVATKKGLLSGLNLGSGLNANYSLIDDAEEKIQGFVNLDYTLGPEFMLLAELKEISSGNKPRFNGGAKYMLNPSLHFDFAVLNIGGSYTTERIVRVTYRGEF
ncbi:MAG: hypothetical protein JXJ19_00980 [Elusimicrobia bacterium]|nr:hypothetical protein [Elusimicrobiota bacterium]